MSKSGATLHASSSSIHIGISDKDRAAVAEQLSKLLADTYTLYLTTHNFHWNVTGPMFNTLHLMFETQYNELWTAADLIAERIRALDVYAPGSYSQFGKLTSIREETGIPDWKGMTQQLVEGHEACVRTARATLSWPTRPTTSPPRTSPRSAWNTTRKPPGCCARC